ncbi:MAG: hypothetical protein RI637_09710 [Acidimicrobiia bacterium]|nr:hypothetical protein [Acidimicrobiia bacterium]
MSTPTEPSERRSEHPRRTLRPSAATPGGSITLSRPLASIAAAMAIVVAAAFVLINSGGSTPLGLSAGESDPALMSCLPFSVDLLADMEVAFEGVVTSVDGDVLTLDVVTWYTGGEAEQVEITAPPGMEALIGGIPFEVGGSYLVTATNGVVNYCGYTGVATPEFRAAFDQAF